VNESLFKPFLRPNIVCLNSASKCLTLRRHYTIAHRDPRITGHVFPSNGLALTQRHQHLGRTLKLRSCTKQGKQLRGVTFSFSVTAATHAGTRSLLSTMEDYTSMQVSYGSPEEPWNVLAAYGGDCYSGKVCNPTGQARQLASDEVRWLQ
jgi:hypothetical protein